MQAHCILIEDGFCAVHRVYHPLVDVDPVRGLIGGLLAIFGYLGLSTLFVLLVSGKLF